MKKAFPLKIGVYTENSATCASKRTEELNENLELPEAPGWLMGSLKGIIQ